MDDHIWLINNKHKYSGLCPACNKTVDVDDDSQYADQHEEVPFEELDAIGDAGASNLRDNGIMTRGDVRDASDEEILNTSWVGEKGLTSIKKEVE